MRFQVTLLIQVENMGQAVRKWAVAYATFANGGTYYAPQYVNKIVFSDGTVKEFPQTELVLCQKRQPI